MKVIKKTTEYTIYQKRNNRYAVKGANKQWLNGEEKVTVLLAEELITVSTPTEPEPASEEAPAEEAPAEEAPAEEAPAEEAPAEETGNSNEKDKD